MLACVPPSVTAVARYLARYPKHTYVYEAEVGCSYGEPSSRLSAILMLAVMLAASLFIAGLPALET